MKKNIKISVIVLLGMFALIGFISTILFFVSGLGDHNSGIPMNNPTVVAKNGKDGPANSELKVFYAAPTSIYGTPYKFMRMYLSNYRSSNESYKRANYSTDYVVNILFYDINSQSFNLLFNKKAKIISMDYPAVKKDSLNNIILYSVITADSDKDGKLDDSDNKVFYVSDLNGQNLNMITSPEIDFEQYTYLGNDLLLLEVAIPNGKAGKENWKKTCYVYDIANKKLKTDNKFSENLEKSEKIIGG